MAANAGRTQLDVVEAEVDAVAGEVNDSAEAAESVANAVKDALDAAKRRVGAVADQVGAVIGKVAAVEGQVHVMEERVDPLPAEIRELKDMASKLFPVMVGSLVVGVVRSGLFCVVCEEVHICVQASRGGKIEDLAAR